MALILSNAESNVEAVDAQHHSIQGTGEMANTVRAMDWSASAFGPIARWSDTLVATVNSVLLSPFAAAVYWGPELCLIYNDAYRAFLADKHPSALGAPGPKVWNEAWPVVGAAIEAAYRHGTVTSERNALIPILVNGTLEQRWFSYSLVPVYEHGEIVGVFNLASEDTAELGRREAEQALRTSEQRFQLAMQGAGLGMWFYDTLDGIVVADQTMFEIFGSLKLNGSVDYWSEFLHPEDSARVSEHFRAALDRERPYDLEYRIVREDGIRWIRSVGRVEGEPGQRQQMFAIIEDITQRKQMEQAIIQNEKLSAVGRLASAMAHEINNPLASVTNLIYLARSATQPDHVQEYLATAERELRRVSVVSSRTLRFYKQSTSPSLVTCADLFSEALSVYQGRLVNSNIQVDKRRRAGKPARCFEGEIRQVLSNLISNAIDAMHPGGGRLFLRSRETKHSSTGRRGLALTIADSGPGMPRQVQENAFEAFYTTKGIGGTGLGLWVCQQIATRHQGAIRIRSAQGPGAHGTVCVLFVPFHADIV